MGMRSKPYIIDWPLTPEKTENINELFDRLFDDLADNGVFKDDAPLKAIYGGTGNVIYAIGDLLYASATTLLSRLAAVATGNALISGGVGAAPAWGKIGLTTHVSGVLPVANGGTAAATLTGILQGNGTSPVTAITVPADATKFLDGTGAFSVPSSGVKASIIMTRVVLGI